VSRFKSGRPDCSLEAALAAEGAEQVCAAIIGHGVEHLHLHLIARYPGHPSEFLVDASR
jgi:diadenosine tetraphosphate (Ap4A) HIT family hydrolase